MLFYLKIRYLLSMFWLISMNFWKIFSLPGRCDPRPSLPGAPLSPRRGPAPRRWHPRLSPWPRRKISENFKRKREKDEKTLKNQLKKQLKNQLKNQLSLTWSNSDWLKLPVLLFFQFNFWIRFIWLAPSRWLAAHRSVLAGTCCGNEALAPKALQGVGCERGHVLTQFHSISLQSRLEVT